MQGETVACKEVSAGPIGKDDAGERKDNPFRETHAFISPCRFSASERRKR